MTLEARYLRAGNDRRLTLAADCAGGEIYQQADGRAAYRTGIKAAVSGDVADFKTDGQVWVPKTASIVMLAGGRAYWDRSASKAHFKTVHDRDFFLGTIVLDAAAADTEVLVDFNEEPIYEIDLEGDECRSQNDWTTEATNGLGTTL